MSRNHRSAGQQKRTLTTAEMPKFWRLKLEDSQRLDAQIVHWDLVTRFTDGSASGVDLWDWIETGFTYSQMATLLVADGVELSEEALAAIAEQLDIYESVAARFRKTGRVGFDARELRIARAAAHVMDGLIELDRHGIAERAAHWSTTQTASIRRRVAAS